MEGSINSIETFGLVDGPGIRTVVFMNGCNLRCKYCHNPEMWCVQENNINVDELVKKIVRNKPYFKRNNGGVTFSGGEPLLQIDFLIKVCKKLKEKNIHIAVDTSGNGLGKYDELFKYVDLILLDIKHVNKEDFRNLTGGNIDVSINFIDKLNKTSIPVWIRQVIVPGIMDNDEYLDELKKVVNKIKNVERIDFLPYHKLGSEKYDKLGMVNPYKDMPEMDKDKCNLLYEKFINDCKN